jgi:hypothetical protein
MGLPVCGPVQVAVEHRETDEKRQADQVLDSFDVLVEVHQSVDLMPLANLVQEVHLITSC